MKHQDEFELKRALDALPRSIEPPADAWPGVRERIAGRRRGLRAAGILAWAERFEPRQIRVAAGIAAIGIGLTVLSMTTRANARWIVSPWVTAQNPPVGTEVRLAGQKLELNNRRFWSGSELVTSRRAEARVRVGSIGTVRVYPETSVRLVESRAAVHRLALAYGMIHAKIDAPPRLFVVETPSGTAIDMGCEYTLHVDSAGNSVLHVELGWVTFEHRGRESLVPGDFMLTSRPGGRIGIPVHEQASNRVRWAVRSIEDETDLDSAVATLERWAERRDAVTLWHVLPRVSGTHRERIYDALAERQPPPEQVTREGALALNPMMMRLWWEALPGTLPITPDWTRRLWMLWLKAASWL